MFNDDYRPAAWADYAGNDKSVRMVQSIMRRPKWRGGAFYIHGPSGVGKTSLANLMALELCSSEMAIEELDGQACTIEAVRDLEATVHLSTLCGPWRAWIVNEATAMSTKAVQGWLTLLEKLPHSRLVVFTSTKGPNTNLFGEFEEPFFSRCYVIELTRDDETKEAQAKRLLEIARQEGYMNDLPCCLLLLEQCKWNLRDAITQIEKNVFPSVEDFLAEIERDLVQLEKELAL